jgi:hypothetical protein
MSSANKKTNKKTGIVSTIPELADLKIAILNKLWFI